MTDGQPPTGIHVVTLLSRASAGSESDFSAAVNLQRAYLKRLAHRVLSPEVRPKEDSSDMVQVTVIEGQAGKADCQAMTTAGLRLWLRRILLRNVLDAHRRYLGTKRRDIKRETSLNDSRSKLDWNQSLLVNDETPSRRLRDEEDAHLVRSALAELKAEYQKAILLHYEDGLTYAEVAEILGKSPGAAERLVKRAVYKLGIILRKHSHHHEQ